MKGICGRLLEIDLSSGKTKIMILKEERFEKYLGGRGLGIRLLYDMLPPKTDPLSPDNLPVFLTEPLTGIFVTGSSKFVVITKGKPVIATPIFSLKRSRRTVQEDHDKERATR